MVIAAGDDQQQQLAIALSCDDKIIKFKDVFLFPFGGFS